MRLAAKRDTVEKTITEYLDSMGFRWFPISSPGLPDLMVSYKGRWVLLEIKSKYGKLTEKQHLFFRAVRSETAIPPAYVVRNIIDVKLALDMATERST